MMRRPAAVSSIPFGYRRRNPAADNIYAVGDQLAVIHSFTGDGTSIALMSGVRGGRGALCGAETGCVPARSAASRRAAVALGSAGRHDLWTAFGRWSSVAAVRAVPQVATPLAGVTRIRLPAGDAPDGYSSSTTK